MKFLSLALLASPALGAVLVHRQLNPGDVPSQCQDACAGALALQGSCASISCLCTTDSDTALQQCANCVIPLRPDLATTLKSYVDYFNIICSGLPPLTFPPIPQSTDPAPPPTTSDSGAPVTTGDASSDPAVTTTAGDSSSGAVATSPDTALPAATASTPGGSNSALTTVRTSSTTVNATQTPRATTTPHNATSTTSAQISTGLFTAEFSRLPVGLLILIATYTLV